MTNRERFQAQFNKCCRQPYVKPSAPLTGIEKEMLEQEEAEKFWRELEKGDHS